MSHLLAPWNGRNVEVLWLPLAIALLLLMALRWVIRHRRARPEA